MADKDSEPRNPAKDFGWLALFLIVLGVIWFAQGGPTKLATMTSGPFVTSPTSGSYSQGEKSVSGGSSSPENPPILLSQNSPYKGRVSLRTWNARETNPQKEYLEIDADYKAESIPISGWTLEGREGFEVVIGNGASFVFSAQVNSQGPIILKAGEKAIITTGRSPIGTNFRLNICTGYFNQFQKFYPSLSEECPRISEEEVPLNFPDACVDYVKRLARCRMPISSVPLDAGNECANFIAEKANYNGCVAAHKNDENFYKKEWRVYLGRDKELWGNQRDTIILRDQDGKLVAQVSY